MSYLMPMMPNDADNAIFYADDAIFDADDAIFDG